MLGFRFLVAATATAVLFTGDAEAYPLKKCKKSISRIQVFGDSLSDNGGAWNWTKHTWPSDPHYYRHRFTDGFVHAEVLAQKLRVPIDDSAIGGATTNNKQIQGYTGKDSNIKVPSILEQVARFIDPPASDFPTSDGDDIQRPPIEKTLFIIYGGANDAIFSSATNNRASATKVAQNIRKAVEQLKAAGARHFLLPTLPPLGHLNKVFNEPGYYYESFSEDLRKEITSLGKKDKEIIVADVFSLFEKILANPKKYKYKNIDDACLKGVYNPQPGGVTICHKPDQYLYFDDYHPGRRAHKMIAQVEYNTLKHSGWIC